VLRFIMTCRQLTERILLLSCNFEVSATAEDRFPVVESKRDRQRTVFGLLKCIDDGTVAEIK